MPIKPRKKHLKRAHEDFKDIPQWKIDFLLTGENPEKFDTFEKLIFIGARPGEYPGRWGNVEPWHLLWERIKDESFIQDWKKQHGLTYAERKLQEFSR